MNLTGRELYEKGIITGFIPEENIQQHGIDLNLRRVIKLASYGIGGQIPVYGKTELGERYEVEPAGSLQWNLDPGAYEVVFDQGCRVPADQRLRIVQRSSILRNGGILQSSVFDAGFQTDAIGTVMFFFCPIRIQVGARVGQMIAEGSNNVYNLYNGQWQGDQQRG